MPKSEKRTTLGAALLATNIGLPIMASYMYFFWKWPRGLVIETFVVTFVVLNVYYLIAFKVWGQKPK